MPEKRILSRDDMELDVGLANDFDGTIIDCSFAVNEKYAAKSGTNDPMVSLTIDTEGTTEKPIHQGYSCGASKQWEVVNGGKEIRSAKSADAHKFNMSSRAGLLVGAMFETVGKGDKAKGQEFFRERGSYMTESPFYTGLRFHWNVVQKATVSGEEKPVLLPSSYLGESKTAAKVSIVGEDEKNLIMALAKGKTEAQLKSALVKEFKAHPQKDAILNEVLNQGLLTRIGLTVTDGKYN